MTDSDVSARFELLLPSEIRRALASRSVVYIPLGTYEWHGEHLPIGLDGLTAHGLCLEAARRSGGLVCPPLYYGTGGGHGAYPWTIMSESPPIEALLAQTLARLEEFDVRVAVILSGHFASEQMAMIEGLQCDWRRSGRHMRARALAVSMAEGLPLAPDHAGLFETTLLAGLWPSRVQIDLLPPLQAASAAESEEDPAGTQRNNPAHPLFGIFGPDPRRFAPDAAPALLNAMVTWLLAEVAATEASSQ